MRRAPVPGGVSLVVPLQDEERTVEALIASISAQTQLPGEVVLVDAGSRDATTARALAAPSPVPLRIVPAGRVYPGVARNLGVQATRSDWIAFTDGGVVLDPRWLAELAARAAADVDVVYGSYEPICDNFFRECAAIAYVGAADETGMRGPSVASCLVRREAFARAGGFPSFRAAEDLIFIRRLHETGAHRTFAPNAIARWKIAGTAAATFRRFESYSYHNLVAGWGRYWHAGVARLYGLLAVAVGGSFFLGAGAWALPLTMLFFALRATRAAYAKRRSLTFRTLTPARVVGAAGIIAIIDLATLAGWARWVVAKAKR